MEYSIDWRRLFRQFRNIKYLGNNYFADREGRVVNFIGAKKCLNMQTGVTKIFTRKRVNRFIRNGIFQDGKKVVENVIDCDGDDLLIQELWGNSYRFGVMDAVWRNLYHIGEIVHRFHQH